MKRIKFNLAIIAVLLGAGAAFATTAPKPIPGFYYDVPSKTWNVNTRSPGNSSGEYKCEMSANPCTATGFDSQGNPLGEVLGTYTVNP